MADPAHFFDGRVVLHAGDCRDVLKGLADASIDAVVTDPPYALVSIGKRFGAEGAAASKVPEGGSGVYARASSGFMGKSWDTGEAAFAAEFWAEVYRVLKPGGHVAAFSGTRTYHRLACAIEDAGFEIRDQLAWAYGSGFPKSHDVSKGIDKAASADRPRGDPQRRVNASSAIHASGFGSPEWAPQTNEPQTAAAAAWQGWGTALKPAWEPICLARKALSGTVATTVLQHGTGSLNIGGCRIGCEPRHNPSAGNDSAAERYTVAPIGQQRELAVREAVGRWPANIVHDGSDEVVGAFPDDDNGGSAARFFYSAKADALDRIGSKHPTVKPVDLMQWLVRLITPPGGTVLDPFAGTGTTGEAAFREGFCAVLVEREAEYRADIARRMALALAGPALRKTASAKARGAESDAGPLFGGTGVAGGASDLRPLRRPGRSIGPVGLRW